MMVALHTRNSFLILNFFRWITDIIAIPYANRLVSGDNSGEIKVWDYNMGGLPLFTCSFGFSITKINYLLDNLKVIIAFDTTVKIYDYTTCGIV